MNITDLILENTELKVRVDISNYTAFIRGYMNDMVSEVFTEDDAAIVMKELITETQKNAKALSDRLKRLSLDGWTGSNVKVEPSFNKNSFNINSGCDEFDIKVFKESATPKFSMLKEGVSNVLKSGVIEDASVEHDYFILAKQLNESSRKAEKPREEVFGAYFKCTRRMAEKIRETGEFPTRDGALGKAIYITGQSWSDDFEHIHIEVKITTSNPLIVYTDNSDTVKRKWQKSEGHDVVLWMDSNTGKLRSGAIINPSVIEYERNPQDLNE